MATTYTYRPSKLTVPQLLQIAKRYRTNLNRFIEDALLEKIGRTQEGEGRALADKVSRVIVEHMGLRLMKPTKAEAARIDRVVKRNNRNKSWVSDEEARPEIYKR